MQQPPPPPGWGPQGYPPPGYPPPQYAPPPPPKKTNVVALIVGAITVICVACMVIGALLPKPPTVSTVTPSSTAPTPTPTAPSGTPGATPPTADPAQPANPHPDRTYVTETCAQVSHTFGAQSELSDLQQEELWRQYDGKWVRWRVKVGDVSETLGQLQMQFKCGREALILDGTALFDDDQRARLLAVRTGSTVEIEAQLSDHGRVLGLSLSDATITSP